MVARLLWEQDVAGSNPVTPTAKQVSPVLTSQPPTQGGFFIALRVVCGQGVVRAHENPVLTTRLSEHQDQPLVITAILFSTEPQVAAGAGVSFLAGISRPVPDL